MNRFTTKRTPRTSSKLGLTILPLAVLSTLALVSSDTAQAAPLPMPAMTGPLQSPSPFQFNAGPLGKLDITGVVSGMGLWQDNPANTVSPDPVAFNGYTHAVVDLDPAIDGVFLIPQQAALNVHVLEGEGIFRADQGG